MTELVFNLKDILEKNKNLNDFGHYLHEGWELKKSLHSDISN